VDFTGLGAFECYLQLMADDAVQPWCSGKTLPPPPEISDPGRVRAISQRRFGVRATEVDAAIQAALGGRSHGSEDDLAPRRRRTGGPK
jgi:hypothetical protein